MSKVKQLLENYADYVHVPWNESAAAPQRVIFCVYGERDERPLRNAIGEFELATLDAGYSWRLFDLTNSFEQWMVSLKYAETYFTKPDLFPTILPKYKAYLVQAFSEFVEQGNNDTRTAVGVMGVGTLFGFLKVKEVVDAFAPMVPGRLVVFFPGSHEGNNYRLLDAYDGWNYLAIPVSADTRRKD